MPTYQYACTECDHRFDAVQSFTDSALTECPRCHGRLRKLFGAVGVVFKGSGFYRTDSRSGGKSSTVPAGASSSDSSSSTSSATTSSGSSGSGSSSSGSSGSSGSGSSSGSGTAAAS